MKKGQSIYNSSPIQCRIEVKNTDGINEKSRVDNKPGISETIGLTTKKIINMF